VAAVFFYISGHGFGHASRQIEIINALGALPSIEIVVRTSAARWLFDRTVRVPFTFVEGPVDTGVVQVDALRLDEAATVSRAAEFHHNLPERAQREASGLRERDARLVIADAPPLGCAAASAAGVASVVVSNFTWDWIYEGYPEHLSGAPGLIATLRDAYRRADAAWRLPMHGGFAPVSTVIDVPLVARHARHDRATVRARLRLPLHVPLVLSSFGGYGLENFDYSRLDCLSRYGVVITGADRADRPEPGIHRLDDRHLYDAGLRYEDLVAAVDVVVTKPGYGIIAECVANQTAMLYTSRGRFAEYDVLVAEMPRMLRCEFLTIDDLLAGRWLAALDRLLALPAPPARPPTNGAQVVADMIRRRLDQEHI
jgi:hypothetical protein